MAKQVERKPEGAKPAGAAAAQGKPQVELRVKKPNVDFPFKLTVEHRALDLKDLFAAAEAFDFYEVNGISGENTGKARRDLCVDVLEVTSTSTTLHVTPSRPMSYAEIGAEMEYMVTGIAKRYLPGGEASGVRVQWVIPNTGIASDMRGRLAVVH